MELFLKLRPGQKNLDEKEIDKYYRVWCEIVPSQYDYSKIYGCVYDQNYWKLIVNGRDVGIADMNVMLVWFFNIKNSLNWCNTADLERNRDSNTSPNVKITKKKRVLWLTTLNPQRSI